LDEYLKFLRSRIGHALILAPATGVIARDPDGRILLQRRVDDGTWAIPGGWMSPGESAAQCAIREAREETGWLVELTGLQGVYSDPAQRTHTYPNGDQAQFVAVIFEARAVAYTGESDGEASEVAFFAPHGLPEPLFPLDRQILKDAVSDDLRPFIR
jgi:ADP-ribose pyrophosphatase YjhB (NUDIX family)